MADFLGIGYEIWGLFGLIFLGTLYVISRPRQSIPVKVLWILRNRAAYRFPAKADLNGIYVDVKTARGKKAVSLLQEGLPIEVREVPKNGKAYVIGGLDGKKPNRNPEDGVDKEDEGKVFYDVGLGRMKHERLFATIEKSGVTIDFLKDQDKNGQANPHGSIVTQEVGATGAVYDRIQQAAGGKIQFFQLIAGFLGGTAMMLLLMVFRVIKI